MSANNFWDLDGTIIFNTPNYKVWVGNFRTRIEKRNLIEIEQSTKMPINKRNGNKSPWSSLLHDVCVNGKTTRYGWFYHF
jgi:hypothetical protein